jgi:two-component system, OmpR family, sensor kinase
MTLRRRLAITLALLGLLLVSVSAVSTALIRNTLISRVDQPLRRQFNESGAPQALIVAGVVDPCQVNDFDGGSLAAFADSTGKQLGPCEDQPQLRIDFTRLGLEPGEASDVFTVKDTNGDEYRTRILRLPSSNYVGFGVSLESTKQTIRRMIGIQLVAIAMGLAGVWLAGNWFTRRGIGSLDRIGDTANAIAAGNRTMRIDLRADEPVELRNVGNALNAMLDESDRSFATLGEALAERERSEDRLRQFVSDASHELKTPLTSIQGYSELLVTGVVNRPAEIADTSRRINSEATRMARLVNDMLQLAQLDAEPQLHMTKVDLVPIIHAVVADAVAADLAWPVEVVGSPPLVETSADPDALHQVFANLLGNVRQHTPKGTRTEISVSTGGRAVSVRIADNGPGVPAELRSTIFERFARADTSRSRSTGGSGLGLSIVRSIVEAHGGSISATPNHPTGTVFTVTLPLR